MLSPAGMRARIAESFTRSLAQLTGAERAAVKRAAFDFLLGPRCPGLHLHRLVHAEDHRFWSLRVNRDLRVIVHRGAGEQVLCWADHHDRAYAWAAHRSGAPGAGADPEPALELVGARLTPPPSPREPSPPGPSHHAPLVAPPASAPLPTSPGQTRSSSPRQLRAWRRAAGPLPPPSGTPIPGAAPAPLRHLLQFFHQAEALPRREPSRAAPPAVVHASQPPGAGPAPPGSRPRRRWAPALPLLAAIALPIVQVLLAHGRGPVAAAALALGAALVGAALVALGWRRYAASTRRSAVEVEAARVELAGLANGLDRLRRGEAVGPPDRLRCGARPAGPDLTFCGAPPAAPDLPPAGDATRAWAAIEALERFLALEAGDLRRLAEPCGSLRCRPAEGLRAQAGDAAPTAP